jgi:hypothetical protein
VDFDRFRTDAEDLAYLRVGFAVGIPEEYLILASCKD